MNLRRMRVSSETVPLSSYLVRGIDGAGGGTYGVLMGVGCMPGVPVWVSLRDGTVLGVVHVAWPISPGDLCAREEGLPLRVISISPPPPGSSVSARVEVLVERRHLFRRGGDSSVPRS